MAFLRIPEQCDKLCVCVCVCVCVCPCVCLRRGNEPSFSSAPRRIGGGGRRGVVDDASEEEGDSQSDYNGTKSAE